MNCTKCGAPLPPDSMICTYCKALNDIDLRGIPTRPAAPGEAAHECPRCPSILTPVHLGRGSFTIDRCPTCHGIFFDPGELEKLIDALVTKVQEVDAARIQALIEFETPQAEPLVQYVRCPICGDVMNRRNYGARSGVIADRCRAHGIWLDGGEFSKLLRWAKAGGRILDEKTQIEEAKRELRNVRDRIESSRGTGPMMASESDDFWAGAVGGLLLVLVRVLLSLVRRG